MNGRMVLTVGGFAVLLVLSGCLGGATSESGLDQDAAYDWDTDADVTIDLSEDSYTAVMEIEEIDELRIYQSTRYGTEHPVGVQAVQFRYPDGTIVNASEIGVRETRNSVYLEPPAENGTIAYTASKQSNEFTSPTLVDGSWEIIIPEGHRVDNLVLGTVRPGGYDSEMVDDRVHVTWEELSGDRIRIQHYLARNLYLFAGLVLAASLAGAVGIGYVYREIRKLRAERAELGLDVDTGDDFDRGPPPGMP